jgi:hypothetical protein
LARLRERRPVEWYARWRVVAAVVTILTVSAASYVMRTAHQQQTSIPALGVAPAPAAVHLVTPDVASPSLLTGRSPQHDHPSTRAVTRTRQAKATVTRTNAELPVIVPDTQARAIARLVELLRTGQLDATNLPAPGESVSRPGELTIRPLTVLDIVIPDVETVTGGLIDTDARTGTGKGV